jgi:tetratricopeptide (TPR) repeat protein
MNKYTSGSLINDRYEVARTLEGGMGIVYLCMDHEEDRPVALKTFKLEFLPNREARDLFLREGTVWMDLGNNAHIVRCYGVEQVGYGNEIFLVLEQVGKEQEREDASLVSWLNDPLPVEQALLFALQIARGMRHAAAKINGFVHCDLKPANVLVGADKLTGTNINRLRVTDFGLAYVLKGRNVQPEKNHNTVDIDNQPIIGNRTQLEATGGTPLYMAPEQWLGKTLSAATDIYALGCILFEMIAGYSAVAARTQREFQEKHCKGDLSPIPNTLPKDVINLLRICLALNPADRYVDWSQVIKELEYVYQNISGSAAPIEETAGLLTRADQIALGWSCNSLGASYMDIGKTVAALPYFERMLGVGKRYGEKKMEGYALNNLGSLYQQQGEFQRAIECLGLSLRIKQEFGDQNEIISSLGGLGIAYAGLGDNLKAIEYQERSLAISRKVGNRHQESMTASNLGLSYEATGNRIRALECFEEALEIDRQIGNTVGVGINLLQMANIYFDQRDTTHALSTAEEARQLLLNMGNLRYYKLAEELVQNIEEVVSGYDQNRNKYEIEEIRKLLSSGESCLAGGDVKQAVIFFEKGLRSARAICNKAAEADSLGSLGIAYRHLKNAEKSINYLENAVSISHEVGDKHGEEVGLLNLGLAYYDLDNIKKAMECYEKSLKIARETGEMDSAAFALYNMALIYDKEKKFDQALALVQESAIFLVKIGSPRAEQAQQFVTELEAKIKNTSHTMSLEKDKTMEANESNNLNDKGLSLAKQNRYEEAIHYYDKALEIDPHCMPALYNKGNSFYSLGRKKEAAQSYRQFLAIAPNSERYAKLINNAHQRVQGKEKASLWTNFKKTFFSRSEKINPKVLNEQGRRLASASRHEEAIQIYVKALESNPEYIEAWHNLAISLVAQKQFDKAVTCYSEITKLDERDAHAWYKKALCEDELNREKEAYYSYIAFMDLVMGMDNKLVTENGEFVLRIGEVAPVKTNKEYVEYARKRQRELWDKFGSQVTQDALDAIGRLSNK